MLSATIPGHSSSSPSTSRDRKQLRNQQVIHDCYPPLELPLKWRNPLPHHLVNNHALARNSETRSTFGSPISAHVSHFPGETNADQDRTCDRTCDPSTVDDHSPLSLPLRSCDPKPSPTSIRTTPLPQFLMSHNSSDPMPRTATPDSRFDLKEPKSALDDSTAQSESGTSEEDSSENQPQQKNEEEESQKQGDEQSSSGVESQEQIEHDTDGNVEESNDTQNQDLSQVDGTVADEERGKSDDKLAPETEQIQDSTNLRIDEEEPKQEQIEEENGSNSHQPEQQIEEVDGRFDNQPGSQVVNDETHTSESDDRVINSSGNDTMSSHFLSLFMKGSSFRMDDNSYSHYQLLKGLCKAKQIEKAALIKAFNTVSSKSVPDLTTNYPRITYRELLEVTGGFQEARLIGSGSFGRVYRGILSDGTVVAVKVLQLQSRNSTSSFNRECQVLKRDLKSLKHDCLNGDALVSTAERVNSFKLDEDPYLVELLFHYGRYLLISSSRPGTQVSNLQGIWNKDLEPPWDAAPHFNINLQMNYWPSLSCNLSECQQPLFDYIASLAVNGAKTTKVNYEASGWVAHQVSDLWAKTSPDEGDPVCAVWPMGGAWLCTHLWDHYTFSLDKEFLENTTYPLLEGCATFLLDWLIKGPDAYLETNPSTLPEHKFVAPAGKTVPVSYSSTMDISIIREVFNAIISSVEVLSISEDKYVVAGTHRGMHRGHKIFDPGGFSR